MFFKLQIWKHNFPYEENFKHIYLKVVTPVMEIWGNSYQGDSLNAETTLEIGWFLSRGYYFRFDTPGVSQTGEGFTDHILWLFLRLFMFDSFFGTFGSFFFMFYNDGSQKIQTLRNVSIFIYTTTTYTICTGLDMYVHVLVIFVIIDRYK